MQVRWLAALQLCELGVKHRQRVRETSRARPWTRAAQNDLFEPGDCACVRASGGAKPQERMLEQREERNRGNSIKRGFRRKAREQPCGSVGELLAGRILDRHIPAFQRRKHAARQCAVGRDERCGLGWRLNRLAQADRDRERLFFGIGGFDDRQTLQGAFDPRDVATCEPFPSVGRGGRPQRLAYIAFAPMRGRRAQQGHLFAGDPDALQQRLHGELRMLEC